VERHFRVLDARVCLAGPEPVVSPIVTAYRRFLAPEDPAETPVRVRIHDGDDGKIEADTRVVPLEPGWDPTFQLYQQFLTTVLENIGSCAVLHAAALVDRSGEGFLIAAPAGHGKSSLTLELVSRGYALLSDDYAPVDLATGTLHPYPRAVAVLADGDAPIPEVFRSAARDPSVARLFSKSLLDVGDLLGEERLASNPVPLRRVILLGSPTTGDPAEGFTWLQVGALRERADAIEAGLSGIDGVEVLERVDGTHLCFWKLRIRHDRSPTAALTRLVDGEGALFYEKCWATRPDFTGAPSRRRAGRREAALLLGRELMNRGVGSRFLARHPGGTTEILFDLAGALRETGCWRVSVGRFEETADLIETILREPA